jgi:hypothetical protein
LVGWAAVLRTRWSLLAVQTAVVAVAVGVVLHDPGPPPLEPSAAAIAGDVWVLPAADVGGFLHDRGVALHLVTRGGPYVVARVSWRRLTARGLRYTIVVSGTGCQAGSVEDVEGVPARDVSLGSGSMYNHVLATTPWLRNEQDVRTSSGYLNFVTFADVRASWGGDVWLVARMFDRCSVSETSTVPVLYRGVVQPHVGVVLTTGDRVWWVARAAG